MTCKTLAVVGASYLQVPLVVAAKEMGLRVIAFAWQDGAVCAPLCDRFYPISIVEKDRILEICRQEKIDGITSIASDVAVPTIAHVAAALGLPGNSCESALLSTDKHMMRKKLADAGLPCPRFLAAKSPHEAVPQTAGQGLRYPLIVKPTDRSGSLGVTKVSSDPELVNGVAAALEASFSKTVVIEEFIDQAREVSVEGISWNGHYTPLAVTDKVTTGSPHFVELEQHQPAKMTNDLRHKLSCMAAEAASTLKIRQGATHTEFMIAPDGRIYVTEVGARMGGDFIGSHLVKLSTGYDFVKAVIECALGSFAAPKKPLEPMKCSGVFFACGERPDVEDFIKARNYGDAVVAAELNSANRHQNLSCSADRIGYVLYQDNARPTSVKSLTRRL